MSGVTVEPLQIVSPPTGSPALPRPASDGKLARGRSLSHGTSEDGQAPVFDDPRPGRSSQSSGSLNGAATPDELSGLQTRNMRVESDPISRSPAPARASITSTPSAANPSIVPKHSPQLRVAGPVSSLPIPRNLALASALATQRSISAPAGKVLVGSTGISVESFHVNPNPGLPEEGAWMHTHSVLIVPGIFCPRFFSLFAFVMETKARIHR